MKLRDALLSFLLLARRRSYQWDEVYESPPYADIFACVAGLLGLVYTIGQGSLEGPPYSWLMPYATQIGIGLIVVAFGIGLRRLIPEWVQRISWYSFGWYWIVWGVGVSLGTAHHLTAWGTIFLSILCWSNANAEYKRQIILIRDALKLEMEQRKLQSMTST